MVINVFDSNGDVARTRAIGGVLKAVRLATNAALPACTQAGAGVGATLTGNAVGILTVDGVNTVINDRILVKNQAAQDDNGIYKVTTEGTAGAAFVLTRATDFDQLAVGEVEAGARCQASVGTVNAGLTFRISTVPATIDTNNMVFSAGNGGPDALNSTIISLDRVRDVSIDLAVTETAAPLTGFLRIEVADGTQSEKENGTLPWRLYTKLVPFAGAFSVSSGQIVVSGTAADVLELLSMSFGWLRVRWVGTLGEGTIVARVTVKGD